MALDGRISCIFYLLFAVTGLIILIVGADYSAYPYLSFTDETFFTAAPNVLFVVGMFILIESFYGCFVAIKENYCMIISFSITLLVIVVAEVAVGISGRMKHQDLEDSLMKHLNETIKQYPIDEDLRSSFDIMQTDLTCCGINSPSDWAAKNLSIPVSCCSGQEISCTPESIGFHKDGCLDKLVTFFQQLAFVIRNVSLGTAAVHVLGVVFACGVAYSTHSQYEAV